MECLKDDFVAAAKRAARRGSMAWGACRYAPLPAMGLPDEILELVSFTRMAIFPNAFHFSDKLYESSTEEVVLRTGDDTLLKLTRRIATTSHAR